MYLHPRPLHLNSSRTIWVQRTVSLIYSDSDSGLIDMRLHSRPNPLYAHPACQSHRHDIGALGGMPYMENLGYDIDLSSNKKVSLLFCISPPILSSSMVIDYVEDCKAVYVKPYSNSNKEKKLLVQCPSCIPTCRCRCFTFRCQNCPVWTLFMKR